MMLNSDLSLVYTGIHVLETSPLDSSYLEPCFRGAVARSILRYPAKAIVLLGASTALMKTSYLKEKDIVWNEALRLPGEDVNFFNKVALMSQVDYINMPLVNYRQHMFSRSKMSPLDYIQGNREAFVDFARFARQYISYRKLHLSWIRLHLIFIKLALSRQNYLTAFKQVKPILRVIPIQDKSSWRDTAAN